MGTFRPAIRPIAVTALLLALAAAAAANVQLMPPVHHVECLRGRSTSVEFTLTNTGDEPEMARFAAYDLDMLPDGAPFPADSGAYDHGCSRWLTVEPAEQVIPPHEQIKVTVTIDVPQDAAGGYYAMFKGFFGATGIDVQDSGGKMQDGGIQIASQAAGFIMLTVPSGRIRAEIATDTLIVLPSGEQKVDEVVDHDLLTLADQDQGWKVVLPIRNTGQVHAQVNGSVSFWTEAGQRLASEPLLAGKGYVLPDRTRNFLAYGKQSLKDGYYMIRLQLSMDDGRRISNQFPFAVIEGDVHPGELTEELASLLKSATPGFRIRQSFQQRTLAPGGKTFLAARLQSTSEDTLRLRARVLDWTIGEDGVPVFAPESLDHGRSCRDWIALDSEEVVLYPRRGRSLKMMVQAPEEFEGEYYACLVFDRMDTKPTLAPELLQGRTQLISLASPKGVQYGVEMDTLRIREEETEADLTVHSFSFRARNTGNAFCQVEGGLQIEKEVATGVWEPVGSPTEFGGEQTTMLPNGERPFKVFVPNLEEGHYRATLSMVYEDKRNPYVKRQLFDLP
jgi:hypothetical protein